jgi:hypothetical protein
MINEPWKTLTSPWWFSAKDARSGIPVPLPPSLDELRRGSWPTMGARRSVPARPTSSDPVQGGLLALLNARTSGGLLRRVAAPADYLDLANYGGARPIPLRTSAGPMPSSGHHFLAPAPEREAVPMYGGAGAAELSADPTSQSPWSAPAGNPGDGAWPSSGSALEVLSDAPPPNYWIPGAQYAGEGHHHNPRAIYGKLPLPEETRKVFDKATTGQLPLHRWHQNDALHRAYSKAIQGRTDDARSGTFHSESNRGLGRTSYTCVSRNDKTHVDVLSTPQWRARNRIGEAEA